MSKSKKTKTPMMTPKASLPASSLPVESWFSIKASADSAEIYIYDEIGGWGVSAKQFAMQLQSLGDIKNISVRIHSPGGDVFEGMAIYNLLDRHPAHITMRIDGLAASMASVIAMAGDVVIMPENAMLMVHKPWGIQGGDADEMRRYADLLDKVEETLLSAYTKKTGMSREEIAKMLEDETWLNGTEAVEKGFSDSVIEPLQAVACLNSKRLQDFENMPEKLKALLKPRAQAPAPSSAPSPAQPEQPTPQPQAAALDVTALQQRNHQINDLFANFGGRHQTLHNQALADVTMTYEQVKDRLLSELGSNVEPVDTPSASASIFAGNGNIVGDAIKASIMQRCGHKADGVDAKDNPYTGMTLRELARMSLAERGIGLAGANPMQMVSMAFTHSGSDFGQILLDVAHKSLLVGWDDSEETFDRWTYKGSLSDFKTAHRVGLEAFPSLRQVRSGAEYKYVTVDDRGEPIALATYGELFSITRQTIINDDLQALVDIPMMMGEAAKATIGDLVYAVLTSNPAMRDGTPLFHTDHKNIADATAGVSVETLDAARLLMRQQKSANRHLNIRPGFILTPTALESQHNQTIKSTSVKGTDANAGVSNPIQNFAEVIAEPRLDEAPQLDWYLAAAKGRDTIEVAYLNGVDAPYIEQQQGFGVDGVATKVRIDAGVAPRDYRGLVKATGTTKK